jgi:hypothetical protein
MSIIAWIVPGLGAGLLADLSTASTRGRLAL